MQSSPLKCLDCNLHSVIHRLLFKVESAWSHQLFRVALMVCQLYPKLNDWSFNLIPSGIHWQEFSSKKQSIKSAIFNHIRNQSLMLQQCIYRQFIVHSCACNASTYPLLVQITSLLSECYPWPSSTAIIFSHPFII